MELGLSMLALMASTAIQIALSVFRIEVGESLKIQAKESPQFFAVKSRREIRFPSSAHHLVAGFSFEMLPLLDGLLPQLVGFLSIGDMAHQLI